MSLIPDKYRLTIWKGSTFRKRLTVLEGEVGSDPQDLTDYTAILEVLDSDDTVVFTLSTANGRIIIDEPAGTITLLVSAVDTAALTWASGHYDLKITAPSDGDTDALIYGSIVVREP